MVQQFLERCLCLDLETSFGGHRLAQRILRIGAVFRGYSFTWEGETTLPEALRALDRFGAKADYVLGHNLLGHDLLVLDGARDPAGAPFALLSKPVIDTLVLSPLAFPEIPYHGLVKGYKLVHEGRSDPVADAKLAARLFEDEWRTFAALAAREPARLGFYGFCFGGGDDGGGAGASRHAGDRGGLAALFSAISGVPPVDAAAARAYLAASLTQRVCPRALVAAAGEPLAALPAWAFAVAWLHVAGGGSVLPRWVRERHPRTVELLDALRCRPCGDTACSYCRTGHDLEALLRRFFGFADFRPLRAVTDGGSLQRELVRLALDDRPLLAMLPTGGGKSLCYQLPALVRHHRRGLLTIVVSPLQALMQDQVEHLNRSAGFDRAAALNGLLTPPERGAVLERVRLGEVAILYVSPEQLRNRSFLEAVEQREIGGWVFDEAHCLSKWGHDFRPDYLYASRFIRELATRQGRPRPAVACFTATAKLDVIADLQQHFKAELGIDLTLYAGGHARPNLDYEVIPVTRAEKAGLTDADSYTPLTSSL